MPTFAVKWASIVDEEAYGDMSPWAGADTAQPRDGFTRAYGATNILEDIATYVENVHRDPDFFKPLIDSSNTHHEVYRQKLDLLHEYRFVTDEDYDRIVGET